MAGITDETEVSTSELAMVLGITARRVQQMTQDGTISTEKRGKFRLSDAVQQYIQFLSKRGASEEDMKLDRSRRAADVTLKASKAKIASLEANELAGKMHRSEDVAALTEDFIYTVRNALMALPGRLAVDVYATESAAEAATVIQRETHKIMQEIAEYRYDPSKYIERVRDRRSWSRQYDDEE